MQGLSASLHPPTSSSHSPEAVGGAPIGSSGSSNGHSGTRTVEREAAGAFAAGGGSRGCGVVAIHRAVCSKPSPEPPFANHRRERRRGRRQRVGERETLASLRVVPHPCNNRSLSTSPPSRFGEGGGLMLLFDALSPPPPV